MGHPVQGGAIIAGIGQTEFSKNSGRSELQLAAEASRAAILDAGLTPDQIDGMVTFTHRHQRRARALAQPRRHGLKWWSETPWGGAGANSTIQHAAAAVTSGAADAVLVYRAFNERSGRRFGQPNAPRDGTLRPDRHVLHVRARHAGEDVRALVPALHARVRREERRLRPLHRRRAQARGDQPRGVVLPAPDHARRPPGVAVDRRAHPAQARLLPGERRRCRAS